MTAQQRFNEAMGLVEVERVQFADGLRELAFSLDYYKDFPDLAINSAHKRCQTWANEITQNIGKEQQAQIRADLAKHG